MNNARQTQITLTFADKPDLMVDVSFIRESYGKYYYRHILTCAAHCPDGSIVEFVGECVQGTHGQFATPTFPKGIVPAQVAIPLGAQVQSFLSAEYKQRR